MPEENAYGFVPVYRDNGVARFLLVHQKDHWSFPKGHVEGNELPLETAKRELFEETGIKDITVIPDITFVDEFTFTRDNILTKKKNTYFLATVSTTEGLQPQIGEISECRFVTYEEALNLFEFENSKEVLRQALTAILAL